MKHLLRLGLGIIATMGVLVGAVVIAAAIRDLDTFVKQNPQAAALVVYLIFAYGAGTIWYGILAQRPQPTESDCVDCA